MNKLVHLVCVLALILPCRMARSEGPEGPPAATGQAAEPDGGTPGDAGPKEPEIVIPPLDWLISFSVMAAWIKNKTTFPIPRQESDRTDKMTVRDEGWGAAFTAIGFYKWLSLADIMWYFPEVNHSENVGGVAFLIGSIPTGTIVTPKIGMGFFWNVIKTRWSPFYYEARGKQNNVRTLGQADFEAFKLDTTSLMPLPQIGIQIKLPLYNWWVQPYYSFWYTFQKTRTRSDGARIDVYRNSGAAKDTPGIDDRNLVVGGPPGTPEADEMRWPLPPDNPYYPDDPEDVEAWDPVTVEKQSHILGLWFNIDFNYFISVLGQYTADIRRNLHNLRLIGTFMLSEYVGISVVYDHQQFQTVTMDAVYFGPCLTILQPGFYDAVQKKRNQAMLKAKAEKDKGKQAEIDAYWAAEAEKEKAAQVEKQKAAQADKAAEPAPETPEKAESLAP